MEYENSAAHHGLAVVFLTSEEIRMLTGFAQKAKQVEHLRRQGIPFYLNASGQPVVARSAVEGGRMPDAKKSWRPAILGT